MILVLGVAMLVIGVAFYVSGMQAYRRASAAWRDSSRKLRESTAQIREMRTSTVIPNDAIRDVVLHGGSLEILTPWGYMELREQSHV